MHFETCYTNFPTVMTDTKEQVTAAWEIMKEGSTVIYPLQSAFYSSARVAFADRFGIRWVIMTETAEQKEQDEKELANEPGFSRIESHKSSACGTIARLVAEKATENCLLWSWERFMMQMKTNDRGLE